MIEYYAGKLKLGPMTLHPDVAKISLFVGQLSVTLNRMDIIDIFEAHALHVGVWKKNKADEWNSVKLPKQQP